MADFFSIDLPRPRTLEVKTQEQFGQLSKRIYRQLGMT